MNPATCTNFCTEEKCDWPTIQDCRTWALFNGVDADRCYTAANLSVCSPRWCNWRGKADEIIGDGLGDDDGKCEPANGENCTGWSECCVDGGDGWWKSDPETCYMRSRNNIFEPDCHERVTIKLDSLPACEMPAQGARVAMFSGTTSVDNTKVFILTYHISQDNITLRDVKIVYNYPPNYFIDEGKFIIREVSTTGETLREIALEDPREFSLDDQKDFEPGMMMESVMLVRTAQVLVNAVLMEETVGGSLIPIPAT